MNIVAAVDGSALSNPGPTGWCWFIDEDTWAAEGWPEGTNNRGELTAVEQLLMATSHLPDASLHILCDSQYVINSVTKWMPGWKRKGWKKRDGKPVMNVDILKSIDGLLVGRKVSFEWVKGHDGHEMNEAADQRARAAAVAYQKGTAVPAGPGYPGAERSWNPDAKAASDALLEVPTASKHKTDYVQEGLFDMPESAVDKREEQATAAHETLLRAVHRAHSGEPKRLEFLTKTASVYPERWEEAFPAEINSATSTLNKSGSTIAIVTRGEGWHALTIWDVAGEAKLVAHQLAK